MKITAKVFVVMVVIFALFCVTLASGTARADEVRGQVTNLGVPEFTWNSSSFAGFYYDIDRNLGAEQLTFRLSNVNPASATLSDQADANNNRGITYNTQAQPKNFKFSPWGSFDVIAFLGELYFAGYGYDSTQILQYANNSNLLEFRYLTKILLDSAKSQVVSLGSTVPLENGYSIRTTVGTDNKGVLIELLNKGKVVDRESIIPPDTYVYKTKIGNATGFPVIATHLEEPVYIDGKGNCKIDGLWQISETPLIILQDTRYDKMSIRNVDATSMTVTMDNKDNQVTLSKNKDVVLMQNIYIKTVDQDTINVAIPLRYFIYKKYTTPDTYELRGSVTNLGATEFTWDNSNFAGFYYDIDKNLGAEKLTFRLTNANPASATLSDQADANNLRGITYNTQAQPKNFKFKAWGQYEVIGFLADRHFAAYDNVVTQGMTDANETVPFIADKSKNDNLMTNEQISKVLMDDNKEMTITSANPLTLAEGYSLAIKSVDVKNNKAYLDLSKNGQVVDSKVVQPSIDNAKMADKTYYYKVDLGDTKEIVQIAVHFKNAFSGADTNIATVDGEFQISDTVTPLKSEQQYDKMSIRTVNPTDLIITMDNKDNQVTLSKNKDVVLMQNIHIKTADQDGTAYAPLRYYIYKLVDLQNPGGK